jgi:hypothetical protein
MPPAFEVRVLSLSPGGERAYDTDEWRDALVVVEQGELELECASGGRRRFRRGSVLWLSGLPLRSLSAGGAKRSSSSRSPAGAMSSGSRACQYVPTNDRRETQ